METNVEAALAPGDRNEFETWVQGWVLQHPLLWWLVSFFGAVVGVAGFALSSYFKNVLGVPRPWKNTGYAILWVVIFITAVVLHHFKVPKKALRYHRQFKANGVFVALVMISIYTFFSWKGEEQEHEQHNKTPNDVVAGIVSLSGFAVMSFGLSIQTNHGFVGELMNFFLEELVVELIKIKWWFGFFGALFSFLLIILRSCKQKHAGVDPHEDPIDNNTILSSLPDIRTDSSYPSLTQEDPINRALLKLNEKNMKVAEDLRRNLIKYISGWSDQIPEKVMEDHNFIKDRIPQSILKELSHEIENLMRWRNDSVTENWLVKKYTDGRKQFLFKCQSQLKGNSSNDQVSSIKKWIKDCNIAVRILIPNERVLCQQVFGQSSPISKKCFEQFCSKLKQDLLSIMQGIVIPERMSSPEITLVFRTVHDLFVPEFRSLFPHNQSMTAEIVDLETKLGKAIRDYYFRDDDFPPEIENSYSCEVHPITKQALQRLGTAFTDRDTIEPILQAYPNPKVEDRMRLSLISTYIEWNVKKLESSLEATFKKTYDYELQGVSIMANVNYILKTAYDSGFELTKKDDWIKQQARKIQRCFDQYWENPTVLLAFLKKHNPKATEYSMTEMLNLFNFNHFLHQNSFQYPGELTVLMFKGFVPNCEIFLQRFRALLNGNQEPQQTYIATFDDEIEDDHKALLGVGDSHI